MKENKVRIEFLAKSENEAFARVSVAAFIAQLDPTIEELTDIKTAVSEAVTNSIIHGYGNDESKIVAIEVRIEGKEIEILIEDKGEGIENIELAKEPLYTSRPDLERSGMGFTVMETFMDGLEVDSQSGVGTRVIMKKKLRELE
ncbi:anti-sigma F factor [Clostridium mediterraneense]|uniref:anti-sigma F factor n=1 Tax=Clostridium mediterraneense TaxID=1805472 RepID=UPI00082E8363|nr:anti-sigma F factor [Clostridium mediterraneense]